MNFQKPCHPTFHFGACTFTFTFRHLYADAVDPPVGARNSGGLNSGHLENEAIGWDDVHTFVSRGTTGCGVSGDRGPLLPLLRAHIPRLGVLADSAEIQPVGVPAGADGGVVGGQAVGVVADGLIGARL